MKVIGKRTSRLFSHIVTYTATNLNFVRDNLLVIFAPKFFLSSPKGKVLVSFSSFMIIYVLSCYSFDQLLSRALGECCKTKIKLSEQPIRTYLSTSLSTNAMM